MRCFQYCPGLIDEKPMIPFKTLTANWPTDAQETWWQNGDNDDNVDDVDDKEEKEEENDDDDDDAGVDSGVGASSDDDDDVVDDDDDEDDDNVHDSDDGGDFARCWCSWWRWRWSWRSMVCHDGTYSQNIFYCSSKILSLKTWLRRPMFSSYNIVTSISSSSKRHPLNCVIAGLAMFLGRSSASFFLRKTWVGNFPPLSVRKIELKWLSTKPSLCLIMLGKEVIQHNCWEMRSSSVLLAKLNHLSDEPWIFRRKDEQRSQ